MILPDQNPNLRQLIDCANRLEPLLERIAFVGGCITGLLVSDPAAAPVRPTLDVDVIVEVASYAELTNFEQRLRELGFRQNPEQGAPVCRWLCGDLLLDFMPVDDSILGFTNRWYAPALAAARKVLIRNREIHVITAPYFLATKLEAFTGRGCEDFRGSRDLEDVITIIDGRSELVEEVKHAPLDLRNYLSNQLAALLSNRDFLDSLHGHLLPDAASQQRAGLVLERMRELTIQG